MNSDHQRLLRLFEGAHHLQVNPGLYGHHVQRGIERDQRDERIGQGYRAFADSLYGSFGEHWGKLSARQKEQLSARVLTTFDAEQARRQSVIGMRPFDQAPDGSVRLGHIWLCAHKKPDGKRCRKPHGKLWIPTDEAEPFVLVTFPAMASGSVDREELVVDGLRIAGWELKVLGLVFPQYTHHTLVSRIAKSDPKPESPEQRVASIKLRMLDAHESTELDHSDARGPLDPNPWLTRRGRIVSGRCIGLHCYPAWYTGNQVRRAARSLLRSGKQGKSLAQDPDLADPGL